MAMTLEVEYKIEPINLWNQFDPVPPLQMSDYVVKINGEICPPKIRDIIIMGLAQQAGITGLTFKEAVDIHLKNM